MKDPSSRVRYSLSSNTLIVAVTTFLLIFSNNTLVANVLTSIR